MIAATHAYYSVGVGPLLLAAIVLGLLGAAFWSDRTVGQACSSRARRQNPSGSRPAKRARAGQACRVVGSSPAVPPFGPLPGDRRPEARQISSSK